MAEIPQTPSVNSERPMRVMIHDTQDTVFRKLPADGVIRQDMDSCREVLSFLVKISGFIHSGC